jgi:hypothetical protein
MTTTIPEPNKRPRCFLSWFAMLLCIAIPATAVAQQNSKGKKETVAARPLLKQTITRNESQRFGYGGTVSIVGAPVGSITIDSWQRDEVAVSANVELQAESEDDLRRLAALNTFVFDQDVNHIRVVTTGTHDKQFMKRAAKDFPKKLLGLPWRIDFRIRVPSSTDLEIDAGRGPISVVGVEGALRISASESETKLMLGGGTVTATIGVGKVELLIPSRSWRGNGVQLRLAAGSVTAEFPIGFSGDIDAQILRTGSIEDSFGALQPRERPGITPQTVKARAGAGGAYFQFIVGDGMVYLKKRSSD